MPLLFKDTIEIDQASFNLTVLAATAGQTGAMDLMYLDASNTWQLVANLATAIPLASPAVTGVVTVSFAAKTLTAGVVYGIALYEEQAFDATLRVTQGTMIGPGTGGSSGFGAGWNLPVGANTSLVTGVPYIRVRRSA